VNLILDKPAVKELIQDDMNAEDLNLEFKKVAADTTERKQILSDYNVLIEKLGNSGASARTAQLMLNYLNNKK
jgi:lipid-A-disaccharide synthase